MKTTVADYRTRVLCLRIEPKTGAPIRLAQHPRDVTMSNGTVYQTGSGFAFSGYSADTGTSPGMIDLEGFAGFAGIDFAAVASGTLDNARAYLFATSWKTPVEDEEPIVASILGKTTMTDGKYRIEEMSLIDALNQTVGQTYTAACPKRFGGQEFAGCKFGLATVTVSGTVTTVTSASILCDAALDGVHAADYFGEGTIQFTSGANLGLKPQEIKSYDANGTIEVYEPFFYLPQAGDTFTMIAGCRHRLVDCRDKWNNVINFGGFSFIPTSSQYAQVGTK